MAKMFQHSLVVLNNEFDICKRKVFVLCVAILMLFIRFFSVVFVNIVQGNNFSKFYLQNNGMEVSDYKEVADEIIEIRTIHDFFMMNDSRYLGHTFRLQNDIDFNVDISWQKDVVDSQNGWEPIDSTHMIGSVFDGGGYSIKNFFINRPQEQFVGLFSKNAIEIKNLFIETQQEDNAIIVGEYGGILSAENYGNIKNVHIKGSISGGDYIGGLIGLNYAEIENCSFDGSVNGRVVGGLIGVNEGSSLINSYSIGAVNGHIAGGLVGNLLNSFGNSIVSSCFANVSVEKNIYDDTVVRVGSFAGTREGEIAVNNCYSQDSLTAIAFGDAVGIVTLSQQEFSLQSSYSGFDFDNDWGFNNKIFQRTIAVSSNLVYLGSTKSMVVGDRRYYLQNEVAELKLYSYDKHNVGILFATINNNDITFVDNKINFIATGQINVMFSAIFLLHVDINTISQNGDLKTYKEYYYPHEDIIFEVLPNKSHRLEKLSATYQSIPLDFIEIETGKYKVDIQVGEYYENSTLVITATFLSTGLSLFDLILMLSIILFVVICIIVVFVIIKKHKKIKKKIQNTNFMVNRR